MKKKLTALFLCALMLLCLAPSGIAETAERATRYLEINATNFPDAYVRQWIIDHLDVSGTAQSGYFMTEAQVQGTTLISLSGFDGDDNYMREVNLTGIERLTNIQELYFEYISLKPYQFSKLKKLKTVDFEEVDLPNADFTGCPALETMRWDAGKGEGTVLKIDLTDCPKLKRANICADCVDVKNCTKLEVLTNLNALWYGGTYGTAENTDTCPNLKVLCCEADGTFDVTKNKQLEILVLNGRSVHYDWSEIDLKTLDLSQNTKLKHLGLSAYVQSLGEYGEEGGEAELHSNGGGVLGLTSLDLSKNTLLEELIVNCPSLKKVDLTKNAALKKAEFSYTPLTALDVSHCPKLVELVCYDCGLTRLNLALNPALTSLDVRDNHLAVLDVSKNTRLETVYGSGQSIWSEQGMAKTGDQYTFDLKTFTGANPAVLFNVSEQYIVPNEEWNNTTVTNTVSYDKTTGVVTADHDLLNVHYKRGPLEITLWFPYKGEMHTLWSGSPGTSNMYWDSVSTNGNTSYMVYRGKRAHEPHYSVRGKDHNGSEAVLDPVCYTGTFTNNKAPGTATLKVTAKGAGGKTCSNWFKIYLPATTATDVENTKNGITISWDAVKDAKGYVIYRRAWSSTTDGWTAFQRWNNTTATTWTDTKVYAGTRYQYGVKAYYSDPMDNYNLGVVGPLKTTVRITTQTLKSVTAGSKQLTAKWSGSKTVTGYQIKYATNAGFTQNVGSTKVAKPDIYQTVLKNLQSGKTYYVTVRAYQVFNGMTYFGEWSNMLSCKVD